MKKQSYQVSGKLTSGSINQQLLLFALPFLGSSLIQQLYNTVDLMFVGNFLGKEAAAAVGAGGLLVTCMVGFFTGMSVGVGVVAARAFGSGKERELHDVIHTAAGMMLLGALVLTVVGLLFAPVFLRWMHTPDGIMPMAVTYIRIYFLSLLSIITYNICSGILRALGNSRSPMIYQFLGGLANIVGNTLFICILDLGVRGAALATLLSQSVAALLTLLHICHLPDGYGLRFHRICIRPGICKQILAIGIPSAIQSMIITFSNIILQSEINSLGVDSIAAFTAYFKVESFIYLPIVALGQANTTFASQNIGAGQLERMKKGTRTAIFLGASITVVISALVLLFCPQAFGLFVRDQEVISLGCQLARIAFPFYFLYVFLEILSGAVRGAGKALEPMIIIVFHMCIVRIGILRLMVWLIPDARGVACVYPLTWFLTSLCMFVYYRYGRWEPKKIRPLGTEKRIA